MRSGSPTYRYFFPATVGVNRTNLNQRHEGETSLPVTHSSCTLPSALQPAVVVLGSKPCVLILSQKHIALTSLPDDIFER